MSGKKANERAYHTEADFTQRWADRDKRPQSPVEQRRPRSLANGKYVDDAFRARVKQMYLAGTAVKQIAEELDCHQSTVHRLRREMGIELRYPKGVGAISAEVKVRLPRAIHKAAQERALLRYKSVSMYIQALIKRDLGK